jgi:hypothetical protein
MQTARRAANPASRTGWNQAYSLRSSEATAAFLQATRNVPIVFVNVGDSDLMPLR